MELKSMAITAEERKEKMKEYESKEVSEYEYPYGLRLHLDNDAIEKLGMGDLPEVGAEKMLMAKVKVCEVAKNEREDGSSVKRVELQITDLALGEAEKPRKPKAEVFYGEA